MPTPAAIVFRPGRRSHRGRPGRRSRPGRRGNRSRARVNFARRCSPSREVASSSASPASAASRSLDRRARAASARASALATSSSASASETGVAAPGSTPERGCGSSGSVTSAGSSEWSASGPSGSCTEKQLITFGLGSMLSSVSCLRGSYMRKCSLVRPQGGRGSDAIGRGRLLAQIIFSN